MNKLLKRLLVFILGGTILTSCKKLLEVDTPPSLVDRALIFSSKDSATAATVALYAKMAHGLGLTNGYAGVLMGMAADELQYAPRAPKKPDSVFETNTLLADDKTIENLWNRTYGIIHQANAVVEGLMETRSLEEPLRRELLGEAKFIRAFSYYFMTGVFGDVPLIVSTNYQVNRSMPRTKVEAVYDQIVADLKAADTLLPTARVSSGDGRPGNIRATQSAARAFLARVYLLRGRWTEAITMATSVINARQFTLCADPAQTFLKNSTETIFQLQPVVTNYNSTEGMLLVPLPNNPPAYIITRALLKSISPGDKRKVTWLHSYASGNDTSFYPYKYKVRSNTLVTEYTVVLRLAELHLILAEAKAKLHLSQGPAGALAHLNKIRARAGLDTLTEGLEQQPLIAAIEQEWRTEFMVEYGHRLLDLKRWRGMQDPSLSRLQEVLQAHKPATWKHHYELWPIPAGQIKLNAQLQQNWGY